MGKTEYVEREELSEKKNKCFKTNVGSKENHT